MCDITDEFHKTLSTLKKSLDTKKLSIAKRDSKHIRTGAILKDLITKIKDVASAITSMKHFLLRNRKDYLNLYSVLEGTDYLSDEDRDKIDNTVETFIKNYTNIISQLKLESCTNASLSEQMKQHCQHVICLVEAYLKHITSIYTEQKQIRVKRALDKCKVSKLEAFCRTEASDQLPLTNGSLRRRTRTRKDSLNDEPDDKVYGGEPIAAIDQHHLMEKYEEEERLLGGLTQEELQMFEQENDQLFDELNALTDEVKKIEGQVVEIAQLQELFTEKVMQQEQELNRVSLAMIGSTENIKDGNEQLRDAMKKNAGFRIVVLFLDWYNP